jgi:hypothetical protein
VIVEGKPEFNAEKSHYYYREEDVDYMVNMLKYNNFGTSDSHS